MISISRDVECRLKDLEIYSEIHYAALILRNNPTLQFLMQLILKFCEYNLSMVQTVNRTKTLIRQFMDHKLWYEILFTVQIVEKVQGLDY